MTAWITIAPRTAPAMIPASDLCPGDVICFGRYPADLIEVDRSEEGIVRFRWGVGEHDCMWLSSNTPVEIYAQAEQWLRD